MKSHHQHQTTNQPTYLPTHLPNNNNNNNNNNPSSKAVTPTNNQPTTTNLFHISELFFWFWEFQKMILLKWLKNSNHWFSGTMGHCQGQEPRNSPCQVSMLTWRWIMAPPPSNPLAATSVATSTRAWPLRKSIKASSRSCVFGSTSQPVNSTIRKWLATSHGFGMDVQPNIDDTVYLRFFWLLDPGAFKS